MNTSKLKTGWGKRVTVKNKYRVGDRVIATSRVTNEIYIGTVMAILCDDKDYLPYLVQLDGTKHKVAYPVGDLSTLVDPTTIFKELINE